MYIRNEVIYWSSLTVRYIAPGAGVFNVHEDSLVDPASVATAEPMVTAGSMSAVDPVMTVELIVFAAR